MGIVNQKSGHLGSFTASGGFVYSGNPLSPTDGDWREGEVAGFYVSQRYEGGTWVEKSSLGNSVTTDHFIMNTSDGGVLFVSPEGDTGPPLHSLLKPSIDGHGAVVGSGDGRVAFITNSVRQLWHAYTVTDTPTIRSNPVLITENAGISTYTASDPGWDRNEILIEYGVAVKEAGVRWRATVFKAGTQDMLVQTQNDFEFITGIREALTVAHGTNGISYTELVHSWPVAEGLATDIVYEFASPVTLLGSGTVGVDFIEGWAVKAEAMVINAVPSMRMYIDGETYTSGEWTFDVATEKLYECNTTGVQTGTFASNSGLWDAVGTGNNAAVALNTTHRTSDGSDHSFLDQAVTVESIPQFSNLKLTGEVSTKGVDWVTQTSPSNQWTGVVYGNGLFVTIGKSASANDAMTSPDGITWTSRSTPTGKAWQGLTFGNGLFVAVADGGTAGNRVMTSSDGITWTPRTTPIDNNWTSVVYGNGLFVAVATTGANRVMTSPDGITWTERAAPARGWDSVTYGNGIFVAVAIVTTQQVMTSHDGINWTIRIEPVGGSWRAVTFGDGLFVAVGDGASSRVMTSPDGATWTLGSVPADNGWNAITYGNGVFVAVAWSGTGDRVMTSPDGINWTLRTSTEDITWKAVTYGDGIFIAVSQDGATNRVMTAGEVLGGIISLSEMIDQDVKTTGSPTFVDLTLTRDLAVVGTMATSKSLYQPVFGDRTSEVLSVNFSEVGTSTQFDKSPNANDAVLQGSSSVNATAGKYGSGVVLNGTTDYALITLPSNLPTGNAARTVEAVINADDTAPGSFVIFSYGTNTGTNVFTVERFEKTLRIFTSGDAVVSGDVFTAGQDHLVQVVYDGTSITAYVDNVLVISSVPLAVTTAAGTNAYIGADVDAAYFFKGTIDYVRLYSRAMQRDELRAHYLRSWSAQSLPAVQLNTTHRLSDGSDHSFIDQSVTVGSSPTFVGLKVTGGVPGLDKVLTSDADGIASWQAISHPTFTLPQDISETATPTFAAVITDNIAVKVKKLTGTTAATEGAGALVAHGLTRTKILSVEVLVDDGTLLIGPGGAVSPGYVFTRQVDATNVAVWTHTTDSENILSKSFSVLITYEV